MVSHVRVVALWRYPVKSMQGEPRGRLSLVSGGVVGDRAHGVLDLSSGTVVSAKRDGRLLEAAARYCDGELRVRLPDGKELGAGKALDEALSAWLGRRVRLVTAASFGTATYECPEDFEDDSSTVERWEGTGNSFVDESDLHVLTTGDLALLSAERPDLQWDARRFRPNIVVEAAAGVLQRSPTGPLVELGDAEVEVRKPCTRCVMTTRPQPGGLERQLDILRHVIHVHNNEVGVRASVVRAGAIQVGDPVSLLSRRVG